jgi:hypothetical protein
LREGEKGEGVMSEHGSFVGQGRNKRVAMVTARRIAAALLSSYLDDAGQPFADCVDQGIPSKEAQRIADAIETLIARLR